MRITTNAARVHREYRKRIAAWEAGLRAGLRNIAIAVERGATARLSGPGTAASGTYPVPVRTGYLRRAMGIEVATRSSATFNSAQYAGPIHNGLRPYGNPHARMVPGRAFLDDAVAAIEPADIMQTALAKVW